MKRVILSVTNDLVADQRIHRVANSLMKNGAEVQLVGRKLPHSLPVKRAYKTYRMKLLFTKGPLFYAEFNIRLFLYLFFTRVDILVANDLDTLPANYAVSLFRRKPLVYDAHELFTEVPELAGRNLVKRIWTKVESIVLPHIKYSYTVCQSIAELYYQRYGITMQVVRNMPEQLPCPATGSHLHDLPASEFVLYQGTVNKGRGLELLVDAFEFIEDLPCLIVGDGDIYPEIKKRIIQKKLEHKVWLTGRIPFEELKAITSRAVLGVSIEENLSLNYYYALPNKLFDYIQANVPVLVSDFPEMKRIVNTYQVGEVLISRQPQLLAGQIVNMSKKENVTFWKQNLYKASEKLCWEMEEEKLLKIYKEIL